MQVRKSTLCLLYALINAFIVHGFLPSSLTDSVIIPIVKDQCKNISDIGTVRPIALSSVLSKVFELILLGKLNSYFCTTDYQFGLKSHHSTDLCIYTLKEVIDFYHSQSTSIYMCFMDASKAFDRVNHWTLFVSITSITLNPPTVPAKLTTDCTYIILCFI